MSNSILTAQRWSERWIHLLAVEAMVRSFFMNSQMDHMNVGSLSTSTQGSTHDVGRNKDHVTIDPTSAGSTVSELWSRREILYFLIWRDIKVRYKQTALGLLWAVLVPLLQTFLFTVIFGRFANIKTDGPYSYTVFVLAGLIPWTFFSQALMLGGQSLINQQHLMTKVYFPRLYLPAAAVGGCLVDFGVGLLLFAIVLGFLGIVPPPTVSLLPLIILLTIAASLGAVFLLAALTVTYRDFKYVIPFAVQVLMYASPIVYPANLISARYRFVLGLNPMTGIVDSYRSAILGKSWDVPLLLEAIFSSLFLLIIGTLYFRKTERRFADIV